MQILRYRLEGQWPSEVKPHPDNSDSQNVVLGWNKASRFHLGKNIPPREASLPTLSKLSFPAVLQLKIEQS